MCGKLKVHAVQHDDSGDKDDEYYTVLAMKQDRKKPIYAFMDICHEDDAGTSRIQFQQDTGATCNVITKKQLPKGKKIYKTGTTVVVYGGNKLNVLGKTRLKISNPKNKKIYDVEFIVVEDDWDHPLIGNNTSQEMELIEVRWDNILCTVQEAQNKPELTKESLLREFSDVFEGTGKLAGQYHIEVDENVSPKVHPPRRMPLATMKKLKTELDRLVELDIIRPVTEPTPWVSSLVVIDRPEKLRICADLRDLNEAVKRSHYPLPTIEDIIPKLGKAKVFSVFDAKNGYWHIELDDESSLLTCFQTAFGRFVWKRLPMGIKSGSEVFQQHQDQVIEGLRQTHCVADDILIYGQGNTLEEPIQDHDQVARNLMLRCRERNLKLNPKKIRLKLAEVPFVGHLVTKDGVRADPAKVKAFLEMPCPEDVAGVQRFLGFVNYLSKFMPRLSDHVEPLRQLTHKDRAWNWTAEHERAVQEVKDIIARDVILRYYDPAEPLVVQCDASDFGLGAALMQDGAPIAFASRTLTQTERNYAQIEKEMLAVVYGLERFHTYTYGRKVHVESDHKPLEAIMRKPLHATPKRIQRMLLRLQYYDIDLKYKKGKLMYLADTLSRAPQGPEQSDEDKGLETVSLVGQIPIAEPRLRDIREHTEQDEDMQILKKVILAGWPESKDEVPMAARPYFSIRDELSVLDGIVFKGEKAVIPVTLRKDMIQRIHAAHIGMEGSLRRARECLYWPGMNGDVRDTVGRCATCQTVSVRQQKEKLRPHETPERPYQIVGTDLMEFDGIHYVVTVDYYSNFWEIDYLPSTKSSVVIRKLKSQFARYGIPEIVMSDNGPQYSSYEFKKFARGLAVLSRYIVTALPSKQR